MAEFWERNPLAAIQWCGCDVSFTLAPPTGVELLLCTRPVSRPYTSLLDLTRTVLYQVEHGTMRVVLNVVTQAMFFDGPEGLGLGYGPNEYDETEMCIPPMEILLSVSSSGNAIVIEGDKCGEYLAKLDQCALEPYYKRRGLNLRRWKRDFAFVCTHVSRWRWSKGKLVRER
jgi:hypothetical protein